MPHCDSRLPYCVAQLLYCAVQPPHWVLQWIHCLTKPHRKSVNPLQWVAIAHLCVARSLDCFEQPLDCLSQYLYCLFQWTHLATICWRSDSLILEDQYKFLPLTKSCNTFSIGSSGHHPRLADFSGSNTASSSSGAMSTCFPQVSLS